MLAAMGVPMAFPPYPIFLIPRTYLSTLLTYL